MDQVTKFIEPGRQFAKDSIRLVKRCTKPDRKGNDRAEVLTSDIAQKILFRCAFSERGVIRKEHDMSVFSSEMLLSCYSMSHACLVPYYHQFACRHTEWSTTCHTNNGFAV